MLKLENLKVGYNKKILTEINKFHLNKGQNCIILGNSGSGKTTLIYTIAGLLRPLGGTITINDTKTNELNKVEADNFRGENIGIIYQTLHIFPALNILNNVISAQFAAGKTIEHEKAENLLSKLSILEYKNKKPSQLSIGQLQRVAIARAAINSPSLLLGDEPTSALDDSSAENAIKLLIDIAKNNNSCLIVATHDSRIKKYFDVTINLGEKNE